MTTAGSWRRGCGASQNPNIHAQTPPARASRIVANVTIEDLERRCALEAA